MPKILLVEDDPFIGDIYKKKFGASGFEVVNVTTGKAVLKAVDEQKYDLILLDLVIPEMSGMEVLKELRTNPLYDPNLKIVVFSNLSSQEDRDEAIKLNANGFISKTDFTPSQVVEEVRRYLRQFDERVRNDAAERMTGSDGGNGTDAHGKRGKNILFIEDEEVFVEMFAGRLMSEGYDVLIARTGTDGLEKALAERFDLIITDAVLPGMNGKEVVERLRSEEVTKDAPIFLTTASLDNDEIEMLARDGKVNRSFLKTKITPSDLAYAVNDFFGFEK